MRSRRRNWRNLPGKGGLIEYPRTPWDDIPENRQKLNAKTRAVYVEYRKAGYSKKFRAEHEADILIHQAAKKYFDGMGITKLPSVKALREEYAGFLEQKRKAYAEYKQARSDMKELQNIKANVDYLLDVPARREAQKDSEKSRQ